MTPSHDFLVIEDFERVAPPTTERTAAFWTSGAEGLLRLAHCRTCDRYLHPPQPVCPHCRGRDIGFDAVSGHGSVYSWTLNRYPWVPSMPPPYLIAEVELAEQRGLRLLSNLVDCTPESVHIGMPVQVCFRQVGEVYIPLFRPVADADEEAGQGVDDGQG